jgi:proline iminopeptidase
VRSLFAVLALSCTIGYSSARAQLNHAQPEWYLPTGDGCKIFVQEFGQGPETIVVLHGGWGAEHSYLLEAMKGFDEQYHLVFYDQRGSLLSPCPVEKISVQKHVEDLEKLRSALGLDQVNIVAHSMGTFLAMEYQQQHPDRVKGLVLMGSLPPRAKGESIEDSQTSATALMNRPEVKAELDRLGLDPHNGQPWTPQKDALAWHINFASVNLYHIDRWRQLQGGGAYYNGASGQAAAKTMPEDWDFTSSIEARSCSTWVIDGDHDYVDPGGKAFRAATVNIPGVHVIPLKDAEHISWIDAPEAFSKTLKEALQSSIECNAKMATPAKQ